MFKEKRLLSFIYIAPIILFFSLSFAMKVYLHHDALAQFEVFKYIFDYFLNFGNLPTWIPNLNGGIRSGIYPTILPFDLLGAFILSNKINFLSAYMSYLLLICLFNTFFLFGIYKLFKQSFSKDKITFLVISIFVFTNCGYLFSSELIYSIIVFTCIPYYLYYFQKYFLTDNFINLIKILLIYLIKFNILFHYSLIFEAYLISIIFLFFLKKNFFINLINFIIQKKNWPYFLIILLLSLILFLNYNYYTEFYLINYNRDTSGNISFDTFISVDDFTLLSKYFSLFTNFFWGEATLYFTYFGLVVIVYSLIKIKILFKNRLYKISLILTLFLFLLSHLGSFSSEVQTFFYRLPLFNKIYHVFYSYLFAKPFILIIISFGLIEMYNDFKKNYKNSLIVVSICLGIVIFLNLIFSFKYLYLLNTNKQYIIYNLVNIFFIILILVSLFFFNFKSTRFKIFLLLLSFLPTYFMSIKNYSFSNRDYYSNNVKLSYNTVQYEDTYLNTRKEYNYDFNCYDYNQIKNKIPALSIHEFIIRGSTHYIENYINTNYFACNKVLATSFYDNQYQNDFNIINILNFDFNYDNSKNTFHIILKNDKELQTPITYSSNWKIQNKEIDIKNVNGFIAFSKFTQEKIILNYDSLRETLYIYFKFIFGGFIFILLNYLFFKNFFKKKKYSDV